MVAQFLSERVKEGMLDNLNNNLLSNGKDGVTLLKEIFYC